MTAGKDRCFNPLSGPEPGETCAASGVTCALSGLNPLSGPEPGETWEYVLAKCDSAVSIRSPDRSPERPGRRARRSTSSRCFNPLSGPEPGETCAECGCAGRYPVFQSALRTGARRDSLPRHRSRTTLDVSIRSPDRSPERPFRRALLTPAGRFNPLSGPEPGETRRGALDAARHAVSIRSPDRSPERPGS